MLFCKSNNNYVNKIQIFSNTHWVFPAWFKHIHDGCEFVGKKYCHVLYTLGPKKNFWMACIYVEGTIQRFHVDPKYHCSFMSKYSTQNFKVLCPTFKIERSEKAFLTKSNLNWNATSDVWVNTQFSWQTEFLLPSLTGTYFSCIKTVCTVWWL
jgi:hypothetical protein